MSAFGGPNIIDDSLVLYLDAGNIKSYPGSGIAWFDKSGNRNNGTLTNGPTFNSGSGGSIVFDGVDDWGLVPQNGSLNLSSNGGTVESIYTIISTPPNNTGVISKRGSSDNSTPYHLGTPRDTTKVRCIVNDGGNFNSFDSLSNLGVGNIAIVSMTFTPTFRGIYINGVLDNSQTTTITLSNNTSSLVLSANGNDGQPFSTWYNNIRLYSIKIYNRALSATEILQNFNAQKGRFNL